LAEIQNPNQQGGGGGQDSRTILAFTSIFLLLFLGFQYFKQKQAPEPVKQQQSVVKTPAPVASAPTSTRTPTATPAIQAETEQVTVIENELYRIRFSNRGGQVKSWILKKYKDSSGAPLDLVNQSAANKFGYPLSLFTYDPDLRDRLSKALYVPSASGTLTSPAKLTFTYARDGFIVSKNFSFDSSYVVRADIAVTSNGAPVTTLISWPSGLGDQENLPQYATSQFITTHGGKTDLEAAKKISSGATLYAPFDWAGISDLYFAAIFLPDQPAQANVVSLNNEISIPRDPKNPDPAKVDQASVLGAALGDTSGQTRTRLYAGPKALDVLASVRATSPNGNYTGPSLEPVVNFGMWVIISKPMFLALRWIYDHMIQNWGWSILIITVVINLAMLPTRLQMMKSSLKMQRIQPQMEAIKAKYKNLKATDPARQKMNEEVFALQKKEGVNMFGSCLPMLVQMPLLFAFYRMLSNVIELRQAHWLWLHDLSAPDPLHILPVFFIITMFLVQYLTPQAGVDPAQQKMMAFTMPVFFGFMTWNLGSGLALYWAFGNVINVIQQTVMNMTGLGREMREIAAKRMAKRNGKPPGGRR
jgi:YidC/Oxa1 family membrane protein insertase